jgi:hypothetical protein
MDPPGQLKQVHKLLVPGPRLPPALPSSDLNATVAILAESGDWFEFANSGAAQFGHSHRLHICATCRGLGLDSCESAAQGLLDRASGHREAALSRNGMYRYGAR